ncbi:MAG TPA: glycosyltransferase family 4 protein [Solirubrobacteraceae bacterium]|nr:glycosyltransferase family 4 protein [Solirubrobacteraceae bacterium]
MRPRIALLPWGDVIEDFLDPLGLGLSEFRDVMSGGWLFGYVEALQSAGVDAAVVCFSREVRSPKRWQHRPTGGEMIVLPVPRVAMRLRASLAAPLAWDPREASRRPGRIGFLTAQPAYQLGPYLATPLRLLAREARRDGWRAIVCQDYEYQRSDLCAVLTRLLRVPAIATFQGGGHTRTSLERLVRPLTIRLWTRLIVASSEERERVRLTYGVPPERIAEVPNPLAVERWSSGKRDRARRELGIPSDAVVVAWHGRLDLHGKGLDLLLAAWRALGDGPETVDRRLLLVGTGPDAPLLQAELEDPALEHIVWINEYVMDKPRLADLLAASDLYAFPSRHEGFPVAPLEAMAAGLPVVASDTAGVPELLPGGRRSGGVIVPVNDGPALTAAIAELLSQPDERKRLGGLARQRAIEGFSSQAIGQRLRRVILQEE